ncbi:hypothetical protein [Bacteroides cellulosilyticus]|uniref:hypothetical protein n=1 Tax=Bacteroides cellulosilyticus TaxID=246787 RepID=UPI003565FF3E
MNRNKEVVKKYLFKVTFTICTQNTGKEYKLHVIKHILIKAEDYEAAKEKLDKNMKKPYCSYELSPSPKDNKKILRAYRALEQFNNAANELSTAWEELDDREEAEEKMNEHLTKHFPRKAIRISFDDFAYIISQWNQKVQGLTKK